MSAGEAAEKLRLDKWLWFARVCKTRALAAQVVEKGRVRVNARRVTKPATAIRAGDILTVTLPSRVRVMRVLALGERRGPASEAQNLYEDVPETGETRSD